MRGPHHYGIKNSNNDDNNNKDNNNNDIMGNIKGIDKDPLHVKNLRPYKGRQIEKFLLKL